MSKATPPRSLRPAMADQRRGLLPRGVVSVLHLTRKAHQTQLVPDALPIPTVVIVDAGGATRWMMNNPTTQNEPGSTRSSPS